MVMGRSRYRIFENEYPHFLTCTAVGWLPLFSHPSLVQIVFDSWNYLAAHNRMQFFGYVIMENHLHLIAKSSDLAKEAGDFKSFTARKIVDRLTAIHATSLLEQLAWLKPAHKSDRAYQVWQEGCHPEQIQSDEMMWQKLEYIHMNPVKRGYVDDPLHWRYSSARNYARQPSVFEKVITDWM